jgi:hypothetical protein
MSFRLTVAQQTAFRLEAFRMLAKELPEREGYKPSR